MPSIYKRVSYAPRVCHWCGSSYVPKRTDQKFCGAGSGCKEASANLEITRALALYRAAYHWALGTEGYGSPFTMVSAAARSWVAEDKAKGRPAPPLPYDMETRRLNQSHDARKRELDRLQQAG